MLIHLFIKDFAIIDQLELDFASGMTVLTGETGAGKSILIDALNIALGQRAESKIVREGALRCEIIASFDVATILTAQQWLAENELSSDDECILRRVITNEGRSQIFINGHLCTLQQVKVLAEHLLTIHGQHEHHALLKRECQRELLDAYAGTHSLVKQVYALYTAWREKQEQLHALEDPRMGNHARQELLRYQLTELIQLNLQPDEVSVLHQEHKQLANAEQLITLAQHALNDLEEKEQSSANDILHGISKTLAELKSNHPQIISAVDLIHQASICVQEAAAAVKEYLDALEINPQRLNEVQRRLELIHDLARKHHVKAEELFGLQSQWEAELATLENADGLQQRLKGEIEALVKQYAKLAQNLSQQRQGAAKQLCELVTAEMQTLNMSGGEFKVNLSGMEVHEPEPYGSDRIEFLVKANQGQSLQSLAKTASGGELSRIGLAIAVITARVQNTATLIFDEVDTGIGGATAEIVGNLLAQLGQHQQVLCVTHLPQVAAKAQQHLKVSKHTAKQKTITSISALSRPEKIEEIARMLGGIKITKQVLAHAEELVKV